MPSFAPVCTAVPWNNLDGIRPSTMERLLPGAAVPWSASEEIVPQFLPGGVPAAAAAASGPSHAASTMPPIGTGTVGSLSIAFSQYVR